MSKKRTPPQPQAARQPSATDIYFQRKNERYERAYKRRVWWSYNGWKFIAYPFWTAAGSVCVWLLVQLLWIGGWRFAPQVEINQMVHEAIQKSPFIQGTIREMARDVAAPERTVYRWYGDMPKHQSNETIIIDTGKLVTNTISQGSRGDCHFDWSHGGRTR